MFIFIVGIMKLCDELMDICHGRLIKAFGYCIRKAADDDVKLRLVHVAFENGNYLPVDVYCFKTRSLLVYF